MSNEYVFGLAVHYYQEKDITVGTPPQCKVIVTQDAFSDATIVEMKPKKRSKFSEKEIEEFEKRQLSIF